MENSDKNVEGIFKSGVNYLENGQLKDAIDAFEEVIAVDDNDTAAHFNLGLACMRMVRKDVDREELYEDKTDEESWILRAISEFNKVLELEPENKEAKDNIKALNELLDIGI
ncbi:hypothetical protein ES703_62302 [subsurface metagenome]